MGAWIETFRTLLVISKMPVAPYVGAWIETEQSKEVIKDSASRTLRGCVDLNSYACTHYGLKESRTLRGCVD